MAEKILRLKNIFLSNNCCCRETESSGKVLCHVRYRFVFINPIMLPPSSLIMRLHGYPRGTDSRVKKNGTRPEERKRYRKKSRALALSDPTFHDRLMWDRVRDQARRRSHCVFYCARDGSLIWNPPHAWERRRGERDHCPRDPFDAYDTTLDILFIPSSPPARREKSSWKKLRRFLEIADSQAIISVWRVRSRHGWRVHCPIPYIGRISSLLLHSRAPSPPFSFFFFLRPLSGGYPLSLLSASSLEVNGFDYEAQVETRSEWRPQTWARRGKERGR